ncbi:hypothetical protein KII77_01175 [Helicobacter pylori]|uniref:hypothetical protein n=1 Tax=Helicobacter pylori TaxID=210 RepID=UPI001F0ECAE0|nr:hypothetical protein [Helicobacter pylori]MCH4603809.1 hypothetical protein [Helicobacter pylori]
MVEPLQSLRLPIGHPLVEKLCKLSLKDKSAFNEEAPIHFKKEVSEEEKIKFKQALRVIHAIVNNEASSRYLSDENQKFIEDSEKITNELIEKTLEIVSYSDVDVDFEAFNNAMLEVDKTAVGLKSYNHSQLLDLDGGHWDLEVPSSSKESVTFRFDNLPKDHNGKEENFYARSSLKDLKRDGFVAIDFGTKSTTASFIGEGGRYCLLSIGGDVDAEDLKKYENPTIVEFRNKEKFLKDYNALSHRPFTEKQDMEVAHEAQKAFIDPSTKGNHLYRFFSQLKQWAGADEKQNFRDLFEDFSLESFAHCTDFNPIEIYAYYIGRCINNMHNGVFLKYFLSYPIKYEKHQAEKIRESFEKGLRKSLPRHVFDDEKTAKNFKVELRASEPSAYALSALKSYGFFKSEKLDKPIYYGVFDFGGGTTDFDFGKWEKSASPKFAYKMTHFSSGGDKYLGGENLLELLAFEAYGQNFQTLKEKDIVIVKPNYDGINEQRFGSFMQKSREARLNLQTIASNLRPFLENLDAHIIEAIEENEEFSIEGFEKDFKTMLLDRNGVETECDLKVDCKELLKFLKDKIDDGVANFFAGFSKVMAENIDDQCRAFHIFLGGNASRSVLVKQAFENAKEKQLKDYKQKTSKEDFTFILYEPLGTEASDKQILELIGKDAFETWGGYVKPTCKTGVAFGLLESRDKAKGIEMPSISSNPVFKYNLGIEIEGKFHAKIHRDSLKPNEYQIFQTKEEWGGFDELEIRYSDKALANTNTLDIEDTQLIFIVLEEHEEVDVKVCCVDSQSIKVGLFKDDQLIYESEVEKL